MENATDALKIAFAVVVFTIALAIAITMFSQLNEVSRVVLSSSDTTQYYEYIKVDKTESSRIVGLETIIPTLYKYYQENYTVLFLKTDGTPLPLYNTQINSKNWRTGIDDTLPIDKRNIGKYYKNGKNNNPVCTFDMDEETYRNEPWVASNINSKLGQESDYKKNLDAFLNGTKYVYPSDETKEYNYGSTHEQHGGFISRYSGDKFKEMLGVYIYNLTTDEEEGVYNSLLKNKKKRVIIYQLQN